MILLARHMRIVTWESDGADFAPTMEYAKYRRIYDGK
jgi:hypothetical protein